MADSKISALPATSTITGVEELPIVQSATTVKVAINAIKTFFNGFFEVLTNKSDSFTASSSTTYSSTKALVDGLATKGSGTILGTLGTTGIYGASQIPYNSGVVNTVVGSNNLVIYNIADLTKFFLNNPSSTAQQGLIAIQGSSGSGFTVYGGGVSALFSPTSISKSNAFEISAGYNYDQPLVIAGTPIVSLAGNTGINAQTRLDTLGFRIGTLADAHVTNTARFEIGAGTNAIPLIKLNSSASIATPINGVVEYDGTDLKITALGTRQIIMKGLRGTFSASATAQTAFTITFGGTQPNATYFVAITALNSVTAVNNFIVSRTTTTFTVTYLTGLTGTVNFDWQITQ